jgi:hypothetical protein
VTRIMTGKYWRSEGPEKAHLGPRKASWRRQAPASLRIMWVCGGWCLRVWNFGRDCASPDVGSLGTASVLTLHCWAQNRVAIPGNGE